MINECTVKKCTESLQQKHFKTCDQDRKSTATGNVDLLSKLHSHESDESRANSALISSWNTTLRRYFAAGADPDITDRNGQTPIFYAISTGWYNLTRLLLEHKADVTCRDKNGACPLHYAATASDPRSAILPV